MAEVLRYLCPFCECEVRVGKPCPTCRTAADGGKKPWERDKSSDGLDLPATDFDYDEFVAREFGEAPHTKSGLKWYWWALAIVLLAAMAIGVLWIG